MRAAGVPELRLLGCNLRAEGRGWMRSRQYSNPPAPGLGVGARDPNGQASQTRLDAPVEPDGRKAKLPRAGPGAPGLCRPLYRLLCRNNRWKTVVGCDHLPLPFLSPTSLPPPSPLPTLSPLSPLCPVPLGHQPGQGAGLASAHQSSGTEVGASCSQGGSERRWGVPGLGGQEVKTQEERGCRVTH